MDAMKMNNKKTKFLALLEDDTILEFIIEEGVICPSCNQDFLVCLASEPPDCSILALTPEQLLSGGYARTIKRDDLTENDRFIKNFTKQKWPELRSRKHSESDNRESRLLIELSDHRLFEFILDDGVTCPSCNQDFLRCLVGYAVGLPESGCTTLDLTPEQLLSSGYARVVAREDVREKDRLVTDFPAFLERWKREILKMLPRNDTTDAEEIEKTMEEFTRYLDGRPSTITEFSHFLKSGQVPPNE